jgi:hypothetical protein
VRKEIIDGVVYVPEEEIKLAFENRIKKLSSDRITAEDKSKELQEQLDGLQGKLGTVDTMADELENYKKQLEEANTRYNRHSAMANYGWIDSELREAVEWSYSKYQNSNDDPLSLSDWLEEIKKSPEKAPVILRPHLKSEAVTQPDPVVEPEQVKPVENVKPPKTNSGVKSAPVKKDNLIDRGLSDLEFYRENRDQIRNAWRKR